MNYKFIPILVIIVLSIGLASAQGQGQGQGFWNFWGVGPYNLENPNLVDDIFIKLIENNDNGEAIFTIFNPSRRGGIDFEFNEVHGTVKDYKIYIKEHIIETKYYEVHDEYNITSQEEYISEYNTWVLLNELPSGLSTIKIIANIQPEIINNKSGRYEIDWIPSITHNGNVIRASKWAWWNNSYSLRNDVLNETLSDLALPLNGTLGYNGTMVYCNPSAGNLSIYYNDSTDIQCVINDTTLDFDPYNMYARSVYHFDSDNNGTDATTNSIDGACNDVATCPVYNTSGMFGSTYTFDGVDDVLNMGSTDTIPNNNSCYSLWVNPETSQPDASATLLQTHAGYLQWGDGTTVQWFTWNNNGGTGDFRYTNIIKANWTEGVWNHIVTCRDENDLTTYAGGVLIENTTGTTGASGNNHAHNSIGSRYLGGSPQATTFFKGSIDDVRIYNFTLNENQVQEIYNTSLGTYMMFGNQEGGTETPITSLTYSSTGVEGEISSFYFNVSLNNLSQSNATLTYNATNYTMGVDSYNGTLAEFSVNVTLPLLSADVVNYFNITYYANDTQYLTSTYAQTVYSIPELNITSGENCSGDVLYWFDLKDEENLTIISGDFDYNFYYGLSNSSLVRSYGSISSSTNFSVCFNSTVTPNLTIGSGEIFYTSDGYVDRRYYIFDDTVVNSSLNFTLYDLLSTSQTSFKLEVEDTSLTPYDNRYTKLFRWYPDLNEYKTVDVGKTDETGSTVIHVVDEDVDYRIGIYETNGSLIYLANPIRMVCLATPCTYTLKISPTDTDYTSLLNIDYTITFNETTGIWDFVYNDASGLTSTMNLTIYRVTSTTVFPVCSDAISGPIGALSCNTSIYTNGVLKAEVYRSASPPVIMVQKVVQLLQSEFKGSTFGLWLSLILMIPIVFLFALVSPVAALVGGIIALLPALLFGSINLGIFGAFAILAGLVAHFLKRVS